MSANFEILTFLIFRKGGEEAKVVLSVISSILFTSSLWFTTLHTIPFEFNISSCFQNSFEGDLEMNSTPSKLNETYLSTISNESNSSFIAFRNPIRDPKFCWMLISVLKVGMKIDINIHWNSHVNKRSLQIV
jgi:hypothetical protein